METKFNVGDILTDKNTSTRYRIICIKSNQVVLCQMDCDTLNLYSHDIRVVVSLIETFAVEVTEETPRVYDVRMLAPPVKKRFDYCVGIIKKVEAAYGPDYLKLSSKSPKPELEKILSESDMSRPTLWRIIRVYLQSGSDLYSLIDGRAGSARKDWNYSRKPGRKTSGGLSFGTLVDDNTKENFNDALDYYKSGRAKTYEDAYDFLCMKYYSTLQKTSEGVTKTLLPASLRPTLRQFTYYCQKHIMPEEIDAIKTSRQEQRNNKRLLLSDNLKGVTGPWDCVEMDEVEVDLSLVSADDPKRVVGRPVVYVMLDLYTRLIVAVSIGFDNNSVLGFTNCLMNLADDKVEYCKKYGLTITENIWPSGYLPKRIRCDRGAEYRSKRVKEICNELGIMRELVTAGTGSLKGSVEQLFHMMHAAQNPDMENIGLIEKRHDSMHHQEATLNINDFTKIFLDFVITYNQRYMKNYPLTKDMLSRNVQPIPLKLWEYGIENNGMPKKIINKNQYYYSLLTPVNARISRVGLTFNGLYYINYKDDDFLHKMYASGTRRVPFECRMDERDISNLYYLRDGKLVAASLNNEKTGNGDYAGLTHAEYQALRKEKHLMDVAGSEHNRQLRVARKELNKAVLDTAKGRTKDIVDKTNDTKEIRKNRRIEQQSVANESSIESHTPLATFEDTSWSGKPSDFDAGIDENDWESAMALFN